MPKIIVFGASGATGLPFVRQALAAGHEVTAIVRNPATFDLPSHPHLFVCKGDVMQLESFTGFMKEKDVVISMLGSRDTKPTTLYSTGMRNIIASMRENNVRRIFSLSAGAIYINAKMGLFVRVVASVLQQILKNPFSDMRVMETEIQQSGLDYTIVRPPRLKNTPLRGKYRIAVNDHLARPSSIARADLAHYILNHIGDGRTFPSIVEVSY
ncbi:MAG TPA: SDR family oxidoreductase [Puia sp.]|nr:SDR family oxidoreductase [Puia sp.]